MQTVRLHKEYFKTIKPSLKAAWMYVNRLFPCSKNSHFQNEVKSKTFVVKMSFLCLRMKNNFHIYGFLLSLALKQRLEATRE